MWKNSQLFSTKNPFYRIAVKIYSMITRPSWKLALTSDACLLNSFRFHNESHHVTSFGSLVKGSSCSSRWESSVLLLKYIWYSYKIPRWTVSRVITWHNGWTISYQKAVLSSISPHFNQHFCPLIAMDFFLHTSLITIRLWHMWVWNGYFVILKTQILYKV